MIKAAEKIRWTKRKFVIKNFMRDNFPLFINQVNQIDQAAHTHDFTEIVLIERGSGVHVTGRGKKSVSMGDVLIAPRGAVHGYENTENLRLLNIIFDIALLDLPKGDLFGLSGYNTLVGHGVYDSSGLPAAGEFTALNPEEINRICGIVQKMRLELADRRAGYKSECVSLLLSLAVLLARKPGGEQKNAHSATDNKLEKTLDYMERHWHEKMEMEHLAKLSNCSLRNFERVFRKITGCSPASYIIDLKLRRAKNLLKNSRLSISEIAAETGFGTGAYLARQFKKNFSMTAKEYRSFSAS
jgi:AraC-like DNA-binding protein/mannose-6-phosphate isomerase-like protein (cupin superfamily)